MIMEQDLLLLTIQQNQNIMPVMLYYVKKTEILEHQAKKKDYQYLSVQYQTYNHTFRLFLYKPYF
jgi:hypothetical protein